MAIAEVPAVLTEEEMLHFRTRGYLGPYSLCSEAEMADLRPAIEEVLETDPPNGKNRIHNRHLDSRVVYDLSTHPEILSRMVALYGDGFVAVAHEFFYQIQGYEGDSMASGFQLLAA